MWWSAYLGSIMGVGLVGWGMMYWWNVFYEELRILVVFATNFTNFHELFV